jgi:hypothetical protein
MRTRWIVVGLLAVAVGLSGCSGGPAANAGGDTAAESKVEGVPGTDAKLVTLTAHAAQRLGIETFTIGTPMPRAAADAPPASSTSTVVPYSAVLYTPDGGTWVYTVPSPLTYLRRKVTVAVVRGAEGDQAVLSQGPPTGTTVVSTGAVELYGTELGLGEVTE